MAATGTTTATATDLAVLRSDFCFKLSSLSLLSLLLLLLLGFEKFKAHEAEEREEAAAKSKRFLVHFA